MRDRFWWKKISELERRLYRELYKKSCYEFAKEFWNEADPQEFVNGNVVQIFCEVAQYYTKRWLPFYKEVEVDLEPYIKEGYKIIDVRGEKKNICINIPPRHSKSMIFSVLYPVWTLINFPSKSASISHTTGLAVDMNKKRQRILNSEKFKFFFPEIILEINTAHSLKDTRGAEAYAVARASATGFGADLLLLDDIVNAEQARRDKQEMDNAWAFMTDTLPSRVNNLEKYLIANIQQRLAPGDITGRILETPSISSQYSFLVLPAEFEEDTAIVCPISGTVITYRKSSFLWPERFGDYATLRAQVGETVWATQYMQKPQYADASIVKEDMITVKSIKEVPDIMQADTIYASHDFPVKSTETSDFLGSLVGYKVDGMLYIKSALEERMDFIQQVAYVRSIDNLYPGIIQIIEDKANGSPILNQLQEEVPGMQAYQPGTQDKPQRMKSATLYIQNVIFVADEWDEASQKYVLNEPMRKMVNSLLRFPFLQHDDVCDAFSQLVNFVFMDRRFQVYGRSFNKLNIYDEHKEVAPSYSTIFFNKEGDSWKVLDIAIKYGAESKLYVKRELNFKANIEDGILKLKEFAPGKNVFIDSSTSEGLYGKFMQGISIERYEVPDFEKSVANLTIAFANRKVMVEQQCKLLRGDIENFKFMVSKDENQMKYRTQKDGFVACIRVAMHYYGGIVY